jgi:hypothetical protein
MWIKGKNIKPFKKNIKTQANALWIKGLEKP